MLLRNRTRDEPGTPQVGLGVTNPYTNCFHMYSYAIYIEEYVLVYINGIKYFNFIVLAIVPSEGLPNAYCPARVPVARVPTYLLESGELPQRVEDLGLRVFYKY